MGAMVNRISICPPEGYYPGNGMAYVGTNAGSGNSLSLSYSGSNIEYECK